MLQVKRFTGRRSLSLVHTFDKKVMELEQAMSEPLQLLQTPVFSPE